MKSVHCTVCSYKVIKEFQLDFYRSRQISCKHHCTFAHVWEICMWHLWIENWAAINSIKCYFTCWRTYFAYKYLHSNSLFEMNIKNEVSILFVSPSLTRICLFQFSFILSMSKSLCECAPPFFSTSSFSFVWLLTLECILNSQVYWNEWNHSKHWIEHLILRSYSEKKPFNLFAKYHINLIHSILCVPMSTERFVVVFSFFFNRHHD